MKYNMDDTFTKSKEIPEGLKVNSTRMESQKGEKRIDSGRLETYELSRVLEMDKEIIKKRWKGGNYEMVLEKIELMEGWKGEARHIKAALLEWMVENEETTMMEENEDILDELESMLTEEGSGVTVDVQDRGNILIIKVETI